MVFKRAKKWLKYILLVIIFVAALLYPLPYYIEQPGNLFQLNEVVAIEGIDSNSDINYSMTTIEIVQANAVTAVAALFSPFKEVVSEQELFGEAGDFESYDFLQFLYMKNASDTATQVAYEAAGEDVQVTYNGAYVFEVFEESDFYGELLPGDLVKTVNDYEIENSEEFTKFIEQLDQDTPIEITFVRDDETLEVEGQLSLIDDRFLVGVSLVDSTEVTTTPKIEFDFDDVGGPSAGLMYTLFIYNQLTGQNLGKGYKVAGTGTISADGSIGPIGGAGKKVVAADEAGYDIFFVPRHELSEEDLLYDPEAISNSDEALEAGEIIDTKMKIVPVDTFQEAVEYLENLK